MQKKLKTMLLLTASLTGVLILTSCGEPQYSENEYTYYTYLGSKPGTWNVHDWETNDESYINSFTEIGLYDVILNEARDGYVFETEMASEFPYKVKIDPDGTPGKDITTSEEMDAIKNTYGYANVTEGLVWEIKLNQAAKWEDGTPIKANDYVESMKRQLDPKRVNFRADSYYASNLVISNAEKYFKSNRRTIEPLYDYLELDTYDFKNAADSASVGNNYHINLGRFTPFVMECFTNADSTTTLHSVLEQLGANGSFAPDSARRIIDAVQYYLLYHVDHTNDENIKDWEKCNTPSDVSAEMMNHDIPVLDFDKPATAVKVRKTKDSSWADNSQLQEYKREDLIKDVNKFLQEFKKVNHPNAYRMIMFGSIKNAEFEDFNKVGIKALDDYTLRLYLDKTITLLDLKFALTGNWLVKTDLYDELTLTGANGSLSTKYATVDVKNYMSYGPYKLTEYVEGHSFFISKNENWYGYTDGRHVGQFQMTGIKTTIIEQHSTAVGLFEQGLLDDLALDANDMKTYGSSSRLTTTPESYTQKISFNSNRAKLRSRQGGNNVKTILANENFRKGLSLSLNRSLFASQTTAGSKPFTGLLNEMYLTDVEIGEMYTSTPAGKSVYNLVYDKLGGDPYADNYKESPLARTAQGYNFQQAVYYVEKAIGEEIERGDLKSGNNIFIEFRVYDNESETTINMANFLRNAFTSVLKDAVAKYNANNSTTIELTLTLETVKDEDYYNSAKAGNYDMIFSIWGGAAISPYGLMQVYCDSEFESCCEYGFKGNQRNEKLYIELDGQEGVDPANEEKSFEEWYKYLVDGEKEPDLEGQLVNNDRNDPANAEIMSRYNAIHEKRTKVLAGLEAGILNRFEAIPLVARGTSALTSFKVENGTNQYINLVGYGGVRFMTFNYNDKQWHEYIESDKWNKDYYKL